MTTLGEAVWWTITTTSTVGYRDSYPVTFEGRPAAALMVAGIALLGVVTAPIASWFVENLRRTVRDVEQGIEQDAARTEVQLAELRTVSARPVELERDRRPTCPRGRRWCAAAARSGRCGRAPR
ncbi:potassium channel family protein [Pseudonocardia sp.]|uniref:potassium channel family protein n=1 Tax=Pseudonocardia sp. TaxID=60912 RepID=UPI0026178E96|nr:potassium channel family protein [Pseudonocardia sp.]